MKNRISLLFWVIASSLFLTGEVLAAQGQFYFTAKSARLGASSQVGNSGNGVYLRWDLVEGNLPADITRFELKRDGVIILAKNIDDLMPQTEIHQMYSGAAEQQRLLQTINLLKKLSLAQNEIFDASNFPAELHRRFTQFNDKAWVFLASRQNFNIARARYRAFLDTEASGEVTYTLHAFNAVGDSAQLGKVTVNTANTGHQLPAVNNFHQIEKTSCNIVESMRDHYSVFLDWAPIANNVTDKTADALQNGGYQIYRTTSNIDSSVITAPLRDIANEAATAAHDQRGNLVFADLERVNSSLVISQGHVTSSLDDPAYMESPQQLSAAGLKPGDKRAYYIVAVDFAGHLGETASTIVQVPDRLKPATPWNIEFSQNNGVELRGNLEWDESTIENFSAYYSANRVICSATASGKIDYAGNQQACDRPVHTRVDISDYLVYRFDSAQLANQFSDSDGDGYPDVEEVKNGGKVCETDTNLSNPLGNVKNHLLKNITLESIALDDNRSKIRFSDSFLNQPENIGKAYWYRIASKTADGNISALSAPVYGLLWDRVLPPRPSITARQTGCCELNELIEGNGKTDWNFTDNVEQLGSLSLKFSNGFSNQTEPVTLSEFGNPLSSLCTDIDSPIAAFWGSQAGRELIYPGSLAGSQQQTYCQVTIPASMNLCKGGDWTLAKKTCDEPVNDGDIVDGPLLYTINAEEADNCVSVFLRISGQYTKVASSCGSATPGTLIYEAEAGSCGFAQSQDDSGNVSPMEQFCTTAASHTPPSPPQIVSFVAGTNSADFSWRLPLEPVAITQIEITSDLHESVADSTDKQFITVPNAGFTPARMMESSTLIHALSSLRDQWCIRMKVIAPGTQDADQVLSSEWSNRVCSTRREGSNTELTYLPWPEAETVSISGLQVWAAQDYVDTGAPEGMAYEKMPIVIPIARSFISADLPNCTIHSNTDNRFEQGAINTGELLFSRDIICSTLSAVTQLQRLKFFDLPFMVYRQARTPENVVGSWVQVSPLIENVYWDKPTLKVQEWRLNDPYFKLFRSGYLDTSPWSLSFVDRYPHIAGYEYRYQIVTFNDSHAIQKIHLSAGENDPWVRASALGALQ